MLAYALQVAAVAQTGLRAVVLIGRHTLDLVVVGAAAGKAVGHEHVEHVGIGETAVGLAGHFADFQFEGLLEGLAAHAELELHGAGLRTGEVEIDEQVVGRLKPHDAVYGHAGIVGGHFGRADALSVDHQLQRGVFHAGKPVGRFYSVYFGCCVHHGHEACRHTE